MGRCRLIVWMVLAGCGDSAAVCIPSAAPQLQLSAEVPDDFPAGSPVALALHGTRRLRVEEVLPGPGGRTFTSPPDHPLQVRGLDDGISIAEVESAQITVVGRAVGTSKLEALDCDGTVRVPDFDVNVLAADRIALWPYLEFDQPPAGAEVALAASADTIGVALWSVGPQPTRLVDSSMQITMAGASFSSEQRSWEQLYLQGAAPGVYAVEVTAAGTRTTLPLVITDHADAVEAIDPPTTIAPGVSVTLCFSPKFEGRHVTGFLWTFVIDGVEDPGHGPINCRAVYTAKTSGTLAVTASAGGQSTTVTLTVQP